MNKLDLVQCEDTDDELLGSFRSVASSMASQAQSYRREIARCYAEIDRLTAEREQWESKAKLAAAEQWVASTGITRHRETIDGVECERITGLDVIVPVGLIPDGEEPAEVRSCRLPYRSRWISVCVTGPTAAIVHGSDYSLRLLLADKPSPAPAPTWTPPASLPDGEYCIAAIGGTCNTGSLSWTDSLATRVWRDYTRPASGRWRVESGRAAYLGPNQEATT